MTSGVAKCHESEDGRPVIHREDLETLYHFILVWTDVLDVTYVTDQHKASDFKTLEAFEKENSLSYLGTFYVKVNPKCSAMELLGLLIPLPFETMRLPGTNQISYVSLADWFTHLKVEAPDQVAMRLMVLGAYFGFWQVINPCSNMHKTGGPLKELLAFSGNLTILVSPGYLQDCLAFVRNVRSFSSTED